MWDHQWWTLGPGAEKKKKLNIRDIVTRTRKDRLAMVVPKTTAK